MTRPAEAGATGGLPITAVVNVPHGGRLHVAHAAAPVAVLVLGHGAGGGLDAADLVACARSLAPLGITVVRHEQPWKAAGGRVAPRPPVLDEGWRPALAAVAQAWDGVPLFVGGRSAGARVACRGAADPGLPSPRGVVCLAFPLHLPGKPERSRVDELVGVPGAVLVVQGERDTFGTPTELLASVPTAWFGDRRTCVVIPGAGHSLIPPARVLPRADALARVTDAVATFVLAEAH